MIISQLPQGSKYIQILSPSMSRELCLLTQVSFQTVAAVSGTDTYTLANVKKKHTTTATMWVYIFKLHIITL